MNKTIRRTITGLVILAVLLSVFWWRTLLWTGQLRGVQPHFNGQCNVITGIIGAEDLVIDRQNRLVFISSHDRRNPKTPGSIWVMPVDAPKDARQMLLPEMGGANFAPHGLDLLINDDGSRSLFVLDHGSTPQHLVRKFAISSDTLTLTRTFESPEFYSPNDLAVIDSSQFYLTNDNRTRPGSVSALFGALLRQKSGNVVWVDGDDARQVASGFAYANGIAASADGQTIYVTASIDQNLRIFDRDTDTGSLLQIDQIYFGSGLDNIDLAEDGSLWIGSHPRLLDFFAHSNDPARRSPSQVFHVDVVNETLKEVYLSAGDPLSASSVAANIDDKIFIGGVFDDAILVCQQNQEKN